MTAPDDDLRVLIANSWPLQEAVRRTAKPSMMAALHRELIDAAAAGLEHEPVEWWHWTDPPPPPPTAISPRPPVLMEAYGRNWLISPGAIETSFIHRLLSGELPYWGRAGSIIAPYVRGPLHASLRVLSWWRDGGTLLVGEEGVPFYSARVARPVVGRPAVERPAVVSAPRVNLSEVEAWMRQRYEAKQFTNADHELEEIRRHFCIDSDALSRDTYRDCRRRVARELGLTTLLRPGRRSRINST